MKLSDALSQLPYGQSITILKFITGKSEHEILIQDSISPLYADKFQDAVSLIKSGFPIEYITSSACFCGFDFKVSQDVLIPRLDSEILVSHATSIIGSKPSKALDLFCGSGCLGIASAKLCNITHLTMVDVSPAALEMAKQNANMHNVNYSAILMDLMRDSPKGRFDVIIANPPYIETDVIDSLSPSVKNHEPHIALDGGHDGLKFYHRIYDILPDVASENASAFLEIGYNQQKSVSQIFEKYNPQTIYDYGNNPRVIWFYVANI